MKLQSLAFITLLFLACSSAASNSKKCPKIKGTPLVYGVGSSTMGTPLGPILGKALKARNINFRKWGVASSGLARPDFHDWPAKIKTVVDKFQPEFFVVSLGTNDYQSIKTKNGWIKWGDKRWTKIYAQRIDKMLSILSGPKKKRAVIWMGPVAFKGKKAEVMAPILSKIMKERVAAFGGPTTFYDTYKATTNSRGRPIVFFKPKGAKKRKKARASDNIHLRRNAVKELLADPILKLILGCIPKK